MKPHRRELLLSAAALLGAPRFAFGQSTAGAKKHLLVVFAEGGWDTTYHLDPKLSCSSPTGGPCSVTGPELDEDPANPDDRESVKTFGQIPIVVNDLKRPNVSAFFEKWHSRAHVINGVWTGSIAHEPCRNRIFTGTPEGKNPDVSTITGFVHGEELPLGSVDLSGWSFAGPLAASTGRIGARSQIAALLEGGGAFQSTIPGLPYPIFEMDPTDLGSVEAFVRTRAETLRSRFSDGGQNDAAINDLLISLDRGERFRGNASSILEGLTIGAESTYFQQIEIALDLIEAKMCHTVTIDTRQEFDTHALNSAQHGSLDQAYLGLDQLMGALEERAMLDDVVVAVVSEMGRTPLRNNAEGKDHWGHTSALLLGAVRGDAVSGTTDHLQESQPMDLASGASTPDGALCKYDNFCAGLLELVDVDPGQWLPGVVPFRGAHPA